MTVADVGLVGESHRVLIHEVLATFVEDEEGWGG